MRLLQNIHITATALLILFSINAMAQQDTAWQLQYTSKHRPFDAGKEDYLPGPKGFYLYENCIYDLVLKNDMVYNARILYIKRDSIVLTTHVTPQAANQNRELFDTISISPASIKKIRLLSDRIVGLFSGIHLRNYTYNFINDSLPKRMRADTLTDTLSSFRYLSFCYITAQGVDAVTVNIDSAKARKTDTVPPVIAKQDTAVHTRNFAWFLPFNAHEVNGLAAGMHTGNANGKSLMVNGINASVDMPAMFVGMFTLFHLFDAANVQVMNNSLDTEGVVSIRGLSVSMGGIMMGKTISGISINGGICESNKANGLFLTGGFNYFQKLNGICGGIRNNAVYCTGIQIGLINACKHLKGVQIGLWNVNSKRKLPFINWGT